MTPVVSVAIFVAFGFVFVVAPLTIGRLLRPHWPNREKTATYECGEPALGASWVQFDLRFYIVALFFLIFDVEVALIYPWAVVFREAPGPALLVGLPFIAIVVLGFAYEWLSGSLDWVRASVDTRVKGSAPPSSEIADLARRDPELLVEEAELREQGASDLLQQRA